MPSDIMVVGRLVAGHPMESKQKVKKGVPQVDGQGQPVMQIYFGVAVPKAGEADWKHTAWGQMIQAEGTKGYPNGETLRPDFAWKIVDGDSPIPNQNRVIPKNKEGYPGHWVLNCSTEIGPVRVFHPGKFDALQLIQNKAEVKCGDYCRVLISCKANTAPKTGEMGKPGVYLNPVAFELSRPGQEIYQGPDLNSFFGDGAAAQTAQAPAYAPPQAAAPPASPPVAAPPAYPQFLTGPPVVERFVHPNGAIFDKATLLEAGWQEAAVMALPRA